MGRLCSPPPGSAPSTLAPPMSQDSIPLSLSTPRPDYTYKRTSGRAAPPIRPSICDLPLQPVLMSWKPVPTSSPKCRAPYRKTRPRNPRSMPNPSHARLGSEPPALPLSTEASPHFSDPSPAAQACSGPSPAPPRRWSSFSAPAEL